MSRGECRVARDRFQVPPEDGSIRSPVADSGFSTVGFAALGNAYFRRRYAILFYSLLFTMVAAPASGALGLRAGLIEIFLGANLIAAIIPITSRNRGLKPLNPDPAASAPKTLAGRT